MTIRGRILRAVTPELHRAAPDLNAGFVHRTLHRAIHGVGPLPPAAEAAEKQLREQDGMVDQAINDVIENHVRLAAAQGFLTNIGGLTTAPAAIPANIAGLAMLQVRMIAAIAHLRGHDLSDPRVRNAILLSTLGEEAVKGLLKKRKVPGSPMLLATAPAHDPELDSLIAGEFTSVLVGRVLGRRAASTVVRRVPVAGGVWGASADAYMTWHVGRYAARELVPRAAVDGRRRRRRLG